MSKAPVNKVVLSPQKASVEAVDEVAAEETVVEETPAVSKPVATRLPKLVQNAADGGTFIIKLALDAETKSVAGLIIVDRPFKVDSSLRVISNNWGRDVVAVDPGSITQTPAQAETIVNLINQITLKKVTRAVLDQAFGRRFGNGAISISTKLN